MQDTGNAMLTELGRRLVSGSLSDAALQQASAATPNFAILPWVNVVKIGARASWTAAAAVGPGGRRDRRQLVAAQDDPGNRRRHARAPVYSLAIDLGLPVGVLTVLGTAVAWQNAQMLQYLLARHGIAFLEPEGFRLAAALPDGTRRGDLWPGHAAVQAVGGKSRRGAGFRRSAPTPAAFPDRRGVRRQEDF